MSAEGVDWKKVRRHAPLVLIVLARVIEFLSKELYDKEDAEPQPQQPAEPDTESAG